MRNLVESTLHRRYHIERQLGQGGMGAVYLAQDLRLQRSVASKVHAIEEHPQLLCFVMGFIEGETLGARVPQTMSRQSCGPRSRP